MNLKFAHKIARLKNVHKKGNCEFPDDTYT